MRTLDEVRRECMALSTRLWYGDKTHLPDQDAARVIALLQVKADATLSTDTLALLELNRELDTLTLNT